MKFVYVTKHPIWRQGNVAIISPPPRWYFMGFAFPTCQLNQKLEKVLQLHL